MYQINLTDAPNQQQSLILPDGSQISLSIYYIPLQYGWFITNLVYGDFTLQGWRIVNSPNLLHQFRNQIPFGLACFTAGNREPTQQEDFNSGAAILYVLTDTEVAQYTSFLNGDS